jgi:hypothetical protein
MQFTVGWYLAESISDLVRQGTIERRPGVFAFRVGAHSVSCCLNGMRYARFGVAMAEVQRAMQSLLETVARLRRTIIHAFSVPRRAYAQY